MKNTKGLTLVELLISAYILLIGICGILLLYVNIMSLTESSWDRTVATSHIESILEEMQNKKTLNNIILTDWNEWAQNQNLKTLPQESFKVIYTDTSSDPLEIQVINQWQRKSGYNSINIRTKLTK